MVVLFIGTLGELRVLLTRRSRQLNNFSGHVSLPGGKSDHEGESGYDVARREAMEEIGLPYDEELNKQGFVLEKLNEMPHYLSRTFLSVRPVVCFLQNEDAPYEKIHDINFILNPGETSSIFSVPLLDLIDKSMKKEYLRKTLNHYKWGKLRWPIKHYFYPAKNENEIPWLDNIQDLSSDEELEPDGSQDHHFPREIKDLWGLTAQILYDLANISVGTPEKNYIGNENLLYGLTEFGGQMLERKRSDWESGMIVNQRDRSYDEILPPHIFKNISEEFKL
jgi:8-oxo-dGTP pyrophosphatase MutT (NUDIX family)